MFRRPGLLVALCLAIHWMLAVSTSSRMGVTGDEAVHLTAGYSYWKFSDYRLHPENGMLPMRLAALPLLGMDLRFPSLTSHAWLNSKMQFVAEDFFFNLGNPYESMLWRARALIGFLGVFALWLVWRWARGLFGPAAGLAAVALAALSPTMLAHSGLVTSDMALTACLLAALGAHWRLLHRATWGRLALATLATGATFLAKMSGVFLIPLVVLLVAVRTFHPRPLVLDFGRVRWLRSFRSRLGAAAALAAAAGLGGVAVVWAAYSFRYEGFNRRVSDAQGYYFSWPMILDEAPLPSPWPTGTPMSRLATSRTLPYAPTVMTHVIDWTRRHRLLPEPYLWGLAHTYKFSRMRPAFFFGEYGRTGWKTFFPAVFLMKSTPPELLLFGLGLLALWRRARTGAAPRGWLYRSAPLVLLFVTYWAMAVSMKLNIGHRHLLPVYPVLFIFTGPAVSWLVSAARRPLRMLLAGTLVLQAVEAAVVWPFYVSYFQPLTGGMTRGYRYFVDSSLDWGQGLPDLAAWQKGRAAAGDRAPLFLSYFGPDSPRARGITARRVADEAHDYGARDYPAPLAGGWYAISATQFQRIYLNTPGPWTSAHESLYRTMLDEFRAVGEVSRLRPEERARVLQTAMDLEELQFARLCHHLRDREPLQLIGGSLLLFRLGDAEVNRALYGPLPP